MAEYKGLSIVFEGDATSLSAALNTISTRATAAQGNLAGINKALKIDPGNAELYTRKLVNLRNEAKATSDRAKHLASATSTLSDRQREAAEMVRKTSVGYNEAKARCAELDAELGRQRQALSDSITAQVQSTGATRSAMKASEQSVNAIDAEVRKLEKRNAALEKQKDKLGPWINANAKTRRKLQEINSELDRNKAKLDELGTKKREATSRSAELTKSLERENEPYAKAQAVISGKIEALERERAEVGQAVSVHDQWKRKLEQLNRDLERNKVDAETARAELKRLNEEILRTTGEQAVNTKPLGIIGSGLQEGGSQLQRFGNKLSALGGKLTVVQALVTGTFGRQVVNETEEFGNAISQVGGYLDVSKAKLSGLNDLALRVGYETQFSATEAAQSMSALAKGGMTELEIKAGGLDATMKLAAAGQMDLASAADITVQSMRAFNLNSSDSMEIADALAGAANASTAEVSDLSMAFANCSAVAYNAGWSIQETAGAIGELTDHGLSGEQAGTALKVMLQRLQSPTNKAKDVMEKYGLEVRDAEGHMKSATEIVDELRDKLGTLDDKSRDNALQTLFGTRSSNAALIFMQHGSDELQRYIDAASESGAASKMAKAQMGELGWALEYLRGEAETAKVNLGNSLTPTLVGLSNAAQDLLEKFNALAPAQQALIGKTALAAAATGPLLLIGGKLLSFTGSMVKGLGGLATGLTVFSSTAGIGASLTERLALSIEEATGGATKMGGVMKLLANGPWVAIGVAVVALGAAFAGAFAKVAAVDEIAKRTDQSISNLDDAVEEASRTSARAIGPLDGAADSIEDVGKAASDSATCLDTMASSWRTYNDTLKQNESSYHEQVTSLERARDAIDKYANKTGLSVGQQAELQSAIDTVNQLCGTQYEVVDAANGKIVEQGDDAEVTAGKLDALIQKQREQARVEMLVKDYAAAQSNYNTNLEAYGEARKKAEAADKAYSDNNQKMLELQKKGISTNSKEYHKYSDQVLELKGNAESAHDAEEKALGKLAEAGKEVDNLGDKIKDAGDEEEEAAKGAKADLQKLIDLSSILGTHGAADWSQDLRDKFAKNFKAMGGTVEDFKNLSATTMTDIVTNYDGSMASLVKALSGHADEFSDEGTRAALSYADGLSDGTIDAMASAGVLSLSTLVALAGVAKKSGKKGEDVAKAYIDGIKSGAISADSSAKEISDYVIKALDGDGGKKAEKAGEKQGEAYAKGIESGHKKAKKSGEKLQAGALASARVTTPFFDAGVGGGSKYASGMKSQRGLLIAAGAGVVSAAKSGVGGSTWAWTSGLHLGQNFAAGISAATKVVETAAAGIAKAVAKFIHHSTPEVGPLHDDDVWGLHLAQNLASGMRRGRGLVSKASLELASAVEPPTMDWGAGVVGGYPSSGTYGNVTNIYINGAMVNDEPEIRRVAIDLAYEIKRRERGYSA